MYPHVCQGELCGCECRQRNDAKVHLQVEDPLRKEHGWVDSDFVAVLEKFANRAENNGCSDKAAEIRTILRNWVERTRASRS